MELDSQLEASASLDGLYNPVRRVSYYTQSRPDRVDSLMMQGINAELRVI